jgi:hypothetical protein
MVGQAGLKVGKVCADATLAVGLLQIRGSWVEFEPQRRGGIWY